MTPERWKCTLYATFAGASPMAVLYRRGPSKHTCLIAWDRSDDSFQVGQWFEGMVQPSWGGLSPNGRWLITFMGKYRGPYGTWTVLSKPPYFTAVALWPMGDTWHGGGWFLSDREMVLQHGLGPYALADGFNLPRGITVLPFRRSLDAAPAPLRACPWQPRPGKDHDAWPGPQGHALIRYRGCWPRRAANGGQVSSQEAIEHRLVATGGAAINLPLAGWAAFDRNGDLLFSDEGRLYRLPAEAIGAVTSTAELLDAARCLADFSDLRFTGVRAPYAGPRSAGPSATDLPPGGDDPDGESEAGFAPRIDRTTREDRRSAKRARKLARP